MRRTTLLLVGIGMVVLVSLPALGHQEPVSPADALLRVVVWGTHMPIDPAAYAAPLKDEVDAYLQRATSYRSARPAPAPGGLLEMVHTAWVSYERRLVAVTQDARAATLAAEYVDRLKPCYEWEGLHDCPEREALFADEYQSTHEGGPFSEFLPLLSAHRWLCAAEAFDYEKRPADSARSRKVYEERIAAARRSPVLLLRTAAESLAARGQCF